MVDKYRLYGMQIWALLDALSENSYEDISVLRYGKDEEDVIERDKIHLVFADYQFKFARDELIPKVEEAERVYRRLKHQLDIINAMLSNQGEVMDDIRNYSLPEHERYSFPENGSEENSSEVPF